MRKLLPFLVLALALAHALSSGPPALAAGNTGAGVGAPTFAAGKFGNALTLDGASQYATLPSGSAPASNGGTLTGECWVKTTSTSGVQVALQVGNSSWLGIQNGNAVASLSGLSPAIFGGTVAINNGAWHHLAVVCTGTAGTLYVDGAAAGTTTSGTFGNGASVLDIGNYNAGAYYWAGQIDESAFWSTARYTGAFTPPLAAYTGAEAGLVSLYHLQADFTDSQAAAPSGTTYPVTNSNLYFSPYNWFSVNGSGAMQANNLKSTGTTAAQTANPGAYVKMATSASSGGYVKLGLDTSPLSGITAANCPVLCWSEDGGLMQSQTLVYSASSTTLILDGALTAGSHTFQVWFRGVTLNAASAMGDRWAYSASAPTGASVVKVLNVQTDAATTLTAPVVLPNTLFVLADSKGEGADAAGSANGPGDQDATLAFPQIVAQALNAEVGVLGWSAQGYEQPGYGNVPALPSAWGSYFSGQSRLLGGLLSPAPTYILSTHGRNGATSPGDITALATAWRGAAPSAKILFAVPDDLFGAAAIRSGANTAHASDGNTFLLDGSINLVSGLTSNDGIHLNGLRGHPRFAASLAAGTLAVTAATTVQSAPLTLTAAAGVNSEVLTWTADSGATNGYEVDWKPSSVLPVAGQVKSIVAIVGPGTLTWTDTSAYRLAQSGRYNVVGLH